MRSEQQPKVEKLVDKYFLPHFYHHLQSQHSPSCSIRAPHCSLCAQMHSAQAQAESQKRQMLLNQDDIDLLELMDPKTTPETYMRSILRLHQREQNLRPRDHCNQPMQLTLTTRKILNSHNRLHPGPSAPGHSRDEGLDDLQQARQEELDRQQICRLRDECYLGLGRLIVQRREVQQKRGLGKTNYHTRQYQLPLVRAEVERLAAEGAARGQRKCYLLASANSRGISFPTDRMPQQLSQQLTFDRFREIVCTLNAIIQQVVYQRKTDNTRGRKTSAIYGWLWMWLLALVLLLVVNSLAVGSEAVSELCLVGALCLLVFILMVSCHGYREEIVFVSLVDLLNLKITDYLNYLNSRPDSRLYWKTEPRLYWIEITLNDDH